MIKLIMKVDCSVDIVAENVNIQVGSFVSKVQNFGAPKWMEIQIVNSRGCDHSGYAQPQIEEGNTQGSARAPDRKYRRKAKFVCTVVWTLNEADVLSRAVLKWGVSSDLVGRLIPLRIRYSAGE